MVLSPTVFPKSLPKIWFIFLILLGYQWLIDAVGHEFITAGNGQLGSWHIFGSITCNNPVARRHAESATLNSLPFGNIAVSKNVLTTNLGKLDFVNGFVSG